MRDIVASIISDTQEEFIERINKVKTAVETIQIDVMDGVFVESEVNNFNFQLPQDNKFKIEAHLMTINPETWIEDNHEKVDTIIVHIETCNDPQKVINFVKDKDKKIGFALRPETDVNILFPYLNQLDLVLVFTANVIGYYGAKFEPHSLKKIKEIRKRSQINIEVDGGVSPKSIQQLEQAGANSFVVGSFLQKAKNVKQALDLLNN